MSKWFRQQLSNKLTHNLIFFAKECFKTFDQANVFLVSSISFDYRTLSNSVDDLKGQCRIQDILSKTTTLVSDPNYFFGCRFIVFHCSLTLVSARLEIISGEPSDTMTGLNYFNSVTYRFWPVKFMR